VKIVTIIIVKIIVAGENYKMCKTT